jgi:hypothetical protein
MTPGDWREFEWSKAPQMPPGPHRRLKLYADVNVPVPLIQELRGAGLVVRAAREHGSPTRPDESIYQEARQRGLVLLTMDRTSSDRTIHWRPPQASSSSMLLRMSWK